jgi:hypothetical protein
MLENRMSFFNHLFFEDDPANNPSGDPETKPEEDTKPETDPTDEKKYSDKDLDRLKIQWKAQWQKKAQKEQAEKDEAAKLATMTETEKNEHELSKLRQQVAELTAEKTRQGLTNTARQMCKDAGVDVSEVVLGRLIGEDADSTANNVKAYIADFQTAVQSQTKAKLSHKAPETGSNKTITKEEIMKIKDWRERQRQIAAHPALFRHN